MKRLILILLFLCSSVMADSRVVGHMEPLRREKITPIHLTNNCLGVSITEWGKKDKNIKELDRLCNLAFINFVPFLKSQGRVVDLNKFTWKLSLLQDGTCYRCLNDLSYRFIDRYVQEEVWGYTSETYHRTFLIDDISNYKFKVVFVHEMFHALSMFVLMDLSDNEALARKFTILLGYGE